MDTRRFVVVCVCVCVHFGSVRRYNEALRTEYINATAAAVTLSSHPHSESFVRYGKDGGAVLCCIVSILTLRLYCAS